MVYQRKVKIALSHAEATALSEALEGSVLKLSGTAARALRKVRESISRQEDAMDEKEASGVKGTFPARVRVED